MITNILFMALGYIYSTIADYKFIKEKKEENEELYKELADIKAEKGIIEL